MSTIITRLFDTYEHASFAVQELEANGVSHGAISLVANNTDDRHTSTIATDGSTAGGSTETGAGTGAGIGTVLGGGAGLLAGLGMLAIPGVGPVVAAGWLIATAVGAGVGAASGGLIGSLVGAGVSETDANVYAEGVRRGGTLVTVRADEERATAVETILDKHEPVNTSDRADSYRAGGWSRFDETAPAYAAGASATLGTADTRTDATRGTPVI